MNELAAAASGVDAPMHKGMQDGSDRTNRFTTSEMAQTHRELAVAPDDWFGKGIHDEGPQPGPQLPARGP